MSSLGKILLILAMIVNPSSQYSIMTMQEYRPPVKSSVNKLHSDRRSNIQSTTSTSTHHRSGKISPEKQQQQQQRRRFSSSSGKSSHAGGIAVPLPDSSLSTGVKSFERRMRDLVLGTPRKQSDSDLIQHQTKQQPLDQYDVNEMVGVPSNVKVINSLEEYKQIVGEERKLLVVVRFFASYCKVRIFHT